jgi:putative cell wall-binding protein
VTRIGGADRFDTAVQLAQAMGDRPVVFLTTGLDFPDALSAGPAAAQAQGAVLFTDGDKRNKTTDAYLQPFVVVTQYAVGGQAASAYPKATALVGDDRYGTNAAVASRFFPTSANVGLATGAAFPDGLTGGASVAKRGGPVLLTDPSTLTSQAQGYLAADKGTLVLLDVFGGPEAVTDAVYQAAVQSQL